MSSKIKLSQAMCIVSFPHDAQMRFHTKEVENAFRSLHLSEAKSTNVADDMPSQLPRFILESGPKQLTISQKTAQLTLNFEENATSLEKTFGTIEEKVSQFWEGAMKFKPVRELVNLGIVLTIHCPTSKTREQVADSIHQKFSSFPKFGELASGSMQFGFLDPELHIYRNISISTYETREGLVQASGHKLSVNLEDLEVSEHGVEIKMDINTRPMSKLGMPLNDKSAQFALTQLRDLAFNKGTQFTSW